MKTSRPEPRESLDEKWKIKAENLTNNSVTLTFVEKTGMLNHEAFKFTLYIRCSSSSSIRHVESPYNYITDNYLEIRIY